MRTIAIAVLLPSALWFHTDVAAQNDPMACLDVTIKRAYDLDSDGQNVPAAIVAVTNECANTFDTVVIECAWTGAGNVIAAQSTTLSNIGPRQVAMLLATSGPSGRVPRGTKPECRISRED